MLIYCFDETTKEFTYTDVIDDGTPVPENATTIAPVNADGTGMYAPTWNGANWVSMSQEDYQAKFEQEQKPEGAPSVTDEQKQQAQYILEFAKIKANVAATNKTLAALTKQVTQITLNNTKEVQ